MTTLLISKSNCPWCDKIKEFMDAEGIEYMEINIDSDIASWKTFIQWCGVERVTVPQVFVKSMDGFRRIGGYEKYVDWYKN